MAESGGGHSLDTEDSDIDIVNAPAAFKSEVWTHFGFVVSRNEKGEKVTDKQQTMCKHCQSTVRHTSGNTSNIRRKSSRVKKLCMKYLQQCCLTTASRLKIKQDAPQNI
ncbi:hypothetical protein ATANTOWER_027389 [Ataeniobius toweri]|uniref:BED-type domain-containing protein n=1 Tax=Ataeniobius toweri TaxID=208326 RepID=A0ABU7AHA9_9TELE|nr:hypothetical protein [Ataeniobius toweri]